MHTQFNYRNWHNTKAVLTAFEFSQEPDSAHFHKLTVHYIGELHSSRPVSVLVTQADGTCFRKPSFFLKYFDSSDKVLFIMQLLGIFAY